MDQGEAGSLDLGAPALARLSYALVPVRVIRKPRAHFLAATEPALHCRRTGGIEADTRALMTRLSKVIERWVRGRPEHWLWPRNR